MTPNKKREEVLSHPKLVKFIGLVTTLFMITTFCVNGAVMGAGMLLDYGFHPNKTLPGINAEFDNSTLTMTVNIPFYVNNTGMFGFNIENLTVDFNIYNSSGLVSTAPNDIGSIPWGTGQAFNVTLIELNAADSVNALNGTSVTIEILFHVAYIFTTTTVNCTIGLPGGLSFS